MYPSLRLLKTKTWRKNVVRIIRSSVWVTDARLPLEAVGEAEPPGGRPPRRQRARAVAVRTRAWGENTIGKLNRWVILKSNLLFR